MESIIMDIFDLSGILGYGFYRKIALLEGSPWHPRMGPNRSRSPTVPPEGLRNPELSGLNHEDRPQESGGDSKAI